MGSSAVSYLLQEVQVQVQQIRSLLKEKSQNQEKEEEKSALTQNLASFVDKAVNFLQFVNAVEELLLLKASLKETETEIGVLVLLFKELKSKYPELGTVALPHIPSTQEMQSKLKQLKKREHTRFLVKRSIHGMADYYQNLRQFPSQAIVKPGFLKDSGISIFPEKGNKVEDLFEKMNSTLLPGVSHWYHPLYFSFFSLNIHPATLLGVLDSHQLNERNNYSSIMASHVQQLILEQGARLLSLPDFLHPSHNALGIVANTASQAFRMMGAVAKQVKIKKLGLKYEEYRDRAVAYAFSQANYSVQRALLCLNMTVHSVKSKLSSNGNYETDIENLKEMVAEDKKKGLIPVLYIATIGTTSTFACEQLKEIREACDEEDMWLHVDSAMAGFACCVDKYHQDLFKEIDSGHSLTVNFSKWPGAGMDSSFLWSSRKQDVLEALRVSSDSNDPQNYTIGAPKPMRALKVFYVFQTMGVEGFQSLVETTVAHATYFGQLLAQDSRFEQVVGQELGLLCIRLKGKQGMSLEEVNQLNEKLKKKVNEPNKLFIVPTMFEGKYALRVSCGTLTQTKADMDEAWKILKEEADSLLK